MSTGIRSTILRSRSTIPILTALLVVLAGCQGLIPQVTNPTQQATNTTQQVTNATEQTQASEAIVNNTPLTLLDKEEEQPKTQPAKTATTGDKTPRKIVVEGDLVSFPNLKATDPDGDPITYTFTPPLDPTGKWQTKIGDAGEYRVTITASDGKNSVSQVVVIEVQPKNKAPQIQLASKEITVKEGETAIISATATDPDGDKVTLTYDGWMTGPTKATTFSDAGRHEVTLTASDGKATTEETVVVIVENVNRAPVINRIEDIKIKEGDKITINPTATDPDGDKITFTYSKPINPDGTWQTNNQDVGKYKVTVTASDGDLTSTTSFNVIVESLNKPPVITIADFVRVDEGQTVTLTPQISDPEGDEMTISYSGWMNKNTYTTTYEDAGSHVVTITASDGINTVKKDVTVIVNDVNRPPEFVTGAFI